MDIDEQARRFARYPGVVERAAELARACAFDLALVAPRLPPWPVPADHTEMSWLRHLTAEGAAQRYGPRPADSRSIPVVAKRSAIHRWSSPSPHRP